MYFTHYLIIVRRHLKKNTIFNPLLLMTHEREEAEHHRLSGTGIDTASLSDYRTLNFRRKKVICLLSNEGNIYSQI